MSVPPPPDRRAATIALILLCEAMAAGFGLATTRMAGTTHFWVDEVLAVWAARLPTAGDVTTALWNGAEFSPPTYDLMLHGLFEWFGSGLLSARAPSIVAVLVAAAAIGRLAWIRLGALSGALAFGLVLNSSLFDFAVQARPYALLVALAALAVLLWDACPPDGGGKRQAAGLAGLLFAAISLHFYAITELGVFAVMEAAFAWRHARWRWPIWLALAAATLAALAWLPLMLHLAAFNAGDTTAPAFYAAPTLDHLEDHVFGLFVGPKTNALLILAVLFLAAGAMTAAAFRRDAACRSFPGDPKDGEARIAIVGTALLAALPIGFILALAVTHVFSARYALLATPGAILLFVLLLRRLPFAPVVGGAMLPLLCLLLLLRVPPKDLSRAALDLVAAAPRAGPLVVGDGNLFLELMESADAPVRARLVHLLPPPGVLLGDASAEHQVARLARAFRPDLPVKDPLTFMASNASFAVLWRPNKATDGLGPWFVATGQVAGILGQTSDIMLVAVKASLSDAQRP